MKITLDGFEFNRIMRTCAPALDRSGTRQALEHIEIRCKDGVGVATAGDGFVLAQCRFKCFGDDGVFLLRSHKSVKNDAEITIEVKGKKIIVSDETEAVTRKLSEHVHPEWRRIVANCTKGELRESITVNPAYLRRILDSFSRNDSAVTFEIRNDLDAIVMRGVETYAMLLPIRTDGNLKRAEFTMPEFETAQEGRKEE